MPNFDILFLIGRILYGGYFLLMGVNHFMKTDMLAGYAQSKGLKNPRAAVYVSGLFLLLGGLGIVLGVYVQWAVLLLVVFLAVVSFVMHAYWKAADANAKMVDMTHFLKNMALLGASLCLLAIPGPWAYSVS